MSTKTSRPAKPSFISSAAKPPAGAPKAPIGTGKLVPIASKYVPKTNKATSRTNAKSSPHSKSSALAAPLSLAPSTQGSSKQSCLIALLKSPKGGTLDQMTELTGWQAHTVRGTISGALRKRLGLNVTCTASIDGGARIYRIVEAAIA